MIDKNCLWANTANLSQPSMPLEGTIQTDVAIIGGGFTGLLSAYYLQKMGRKATIIEQNIIGSGASGLNGGMLIPSYRENLDKIAENLGLEAAGKMLKLQLDAATLLKDIIQEHDIKCSLTLGGYLKAAHTLEYVESFKRNQEFMYENFGLETIVVSDAETKAHLNSDLYCGGAIDPNGMSFHPYNYALGIAEVIKQLGATIYEQTNVTEIKKTDSEYILYTQNGKVKADHVIVATNGYTTNITPKLRSSIVPRDTYVIATEILPESFAKQLLPTFKSVSDTMPLKYYFRLTPDNRMLFGGSVDEEGIGSEAKYQQIHGNMLTVFPQLKEYSIEFKWGGKVAMTADEFPHIGTTREGIHYALGYNGRGALLSTMMGKLLAFNVIGEKRELNPLEIISLPEIMTNTSM